MVIAYLSSLCSDSDIPAHCQDDLSSIHCYTLALLFFAHQWGCHELYLICVCHVCNAVFTLSSRVMMETNTLLLCGNKHHNDKKVKKNTQVLSLVVTFGLKFKADGYIKLLRAIQCVCTCCDPLRHQQNLRRVCFLVDTQSHSASPWHKLMTQGYCSESEHVLGRYKKTFFFYFSAPHRLDVY